LRSFCEPGTYIEEISSGVHTIQGVETSVTVFIGRASRGPANIATKISKWQEFEHDFGGIDGENLLGYSVSGFFSNGGSSAYIIRLTDSSASPAKVIVDNKFELLTKDPGEWGNHYRVRTKTSSSDPQRFSFQVLYFKDENDPVESNGVVVDEMSDLTMDPKDPRYSINSINHISRDLIATIIDTSGIPPVEAGVALKLTGGSEGTVLLPNTLPFENALFDSSGNIPLLETIDLFNILCIPGETNPAVISRLETYCRKKRAFLIVDCPKEAAISSFDTIKGLDSLITGSDSINAAYYFPWLKISDPLDKKSPRLVPPCGFVAGVYSRTDISRGVFKAPAGTGAIVSGISGLKETLTDKDMGMLSQKGVNCIRILSNQGIVVWGARTLRGNAAFGSEWMYIPVRRLALFVEESLRRGTQWVVFEPNDERLWSTIRLNVGAFMHEFFRQGAFQGATQREAYYVKCDKETTTQDDIRKGIVNIEVGFAPLKPAEFIVIKIQQVAGEIQA
jgi:uncharacterized protein